MKKPVISPQLKLQILNLLTTALDGLPDHPEALVKIRESKAAENHGYKTISASVQMESDLPGAPPQIRARFSDHLDLKSGSGYQDLALEAGNGQSFYYRNPKDQKKASPGSMLDYNNWGGVDRHNNWDDEDGALAGILREVANRANVRMSYNAPSTYSIAPAKSEGLFAAGMEGASITLKPEAYEKKPVRAAIQAMIQETLAEMPSMSDTELLAPGSFVRRTKSTTVAARS